MKATEFINEMTWLGPDYSDLAKKFGASNSQTWYNNGKYIADIEQYRVRVYNNYYSLWNNEQLVAYTSLRDNVVDDVWVDENLRGQKLFSKLLWFYKSRLNVSPLYLGKVHSPMMLEVVKGLSRFNKKWFNVRTHKIEPFEVNTITDFYGEHGITDWRLMIENMGDFSDWPMFNTGSSYITEDYTAIIE